MRVTIGVRGSGKTDALIRVCADGWYYMVCLNAKEVERVADRARTLGLDIPFPCTFDEFLGSKNDRSMVRGWVIDNVDHLLQGLSGRTPVVEVSFTPELTMGD